MTPFMSKETGNKLNVDAIFDRINPISPYGKQQKKDMPVYRPGQEHLLKEEYGLMSYMEKYYVDREVISVLNHSKDIGESINRAVNGEVLSVVELFEVKHFAMNTMRILKTFRDNKFYDSIRIESLMDMVDLLDPAKERLSTFYIYDDYSEALKEVREQKNEVNHELKRLTKNVKDRLLAEYKGMGLRLSLKGDAHVNKSEERLLQRLDEDHRVYRSSQSVTSIVFSIRHTEEMSKLEVTYNDLKAKEEDEEYAVMAKLSKAIGERQESFRKNFEALGKIDLVLAKLRQAKGTNAIMPTIVENHCIRITNGRHVKTEEVQKKKEKSYTPVSIQLDVPTTSITGANMGGKTVTLKMIGQIAWAVAMGLYVPAEACTMGLSNYLFISIGDEQSVERGLSTFGAEIENLAKAFQFVNDRSLILIDELAGGTNPMEGYGITRSVIEFLSDKDSLSVITTHFDQAAGDKVQRLQVAGLKKIDLKQLEAELIENPDKGMDIISENMDYRLIPADLGETVPKDAINIAELMGMQKEIIERAKKYVEGM
jgi:dsDNA-specific endonuclease/ATPase MutS2